MQWIEPIELLALTICAWRIAVSLARIAKSLRVQADPDSEEDDT